ncbi:hypothetical protein BDR05DRAFT_947896 [Suillus weaverae]|nr:hypothetical protein BDR05DRAFT_947896 [Suillus weaverae]
MGHTGTLGSASFPIVAAVNKTGLVLEYGGMVEENIEVSESNIESSKSSDEKVLSEELSIETMEVGSSIGEASNSEDISNIGTTKSLSSNSTFAFAAPGPIGGDAAGMLRRDEPRLEDQDDVGMVGGKLDDCSNGSGDMGTLQGICLLLCSGKMFIAWLLVQTTGKSPTVVVHTCFLMI